MKTRPKATPESNASYSFATELEELHAMVQRDCVYVPKKARTGGAKTPCEARKHDTTPATPLAMALRA